MHRSVNDSINSKLVDFVVKNFKKRVISLISYGSSLSNGSNNPADHDFLLLLDRYDLNDYELIQKIKQKSKIDLFIDYRDQIERKGINNYQRGRHGVYFFVSLAYADCIWGINYYKDNLRKVDNLKVKRDLLFRIEEYFYRIQKYYVNNNLNDVDYIEKYLSRIMLDILLFNGGVPFKDIHKIHYKDIITLFMKDSKLCSKTLRLKLSKFVSSKKLDLVLDIIGRLNLVYMLCFDELNRLYEKK